MMIDGISGGGGPMRGPISPRTAPAQTPAQTPAQNAAKTTASDPARAVRRAAPSNDIAAPRSGASALVTDMAKAPPVNAGRVAQLKALVESGRYQVDPLAIADAMLKLDRGRP